MRLHTLVREPLVHFLVIGLLLFLAFQRWGGGPGSNRIVITSGQIDSLVAGFTRTWQRPPTEQELKELVDDFVREEIATREAMAMGLDRDDTVIRRRLRQKLEFLAEDALEASPPTDEDLQAWIDRHADKVRAEPMLAFRQVYLNPDRRGRAIDREALALLARLKTAGPDASLEALGDSLMLPADVPLSSRSDVARLFGDAFTDTALELEPGRWAGPITSGHGLHLVFVRERFEGRLPALDEIRRTVEREVLAERRITGLNAMYQTLLERYDVVIEPRGTDADGAKPTEPVAGDAK